jgi:predicted flap endonuclease-1-like 5' DNA nuclease
LTAESALDRLIAETGADESVVKEAFSRLVEKGTDVEAAYETCHQQFCIEPTDPTVFDIPGIGVSRGHELCSAGFTSVEQLAETRPVDLADATSVGERISTTAIEGARELMGHEESTVTRLSAQTGRQAERFENALSQLAAAAVPPSAAEPTLRELYGPSVADIDGVDGRVAYFLFEAGYTTPWEVMQASTEELEDVDYVGPTTAESIAASAAELVDSS